MARPDEERASAPEATAARSTWRPSTGPSTTVRSRCASRSTPAKELEAYLDCGLPCRGFARLRCGFCGESRIVAFSCKGRGFCPSCLGRRMCATAANLMERVLPPESSLQAVGPHLPVLVDKASGRGRRPPLSPHADLPGDGARVLPRARGQRGRHGRDDRLRHRNPENSVRPPAGPSLPRGRPRWRVARGG